MRLGRYELASELGEGGMASVFGARDTELGRDVAVKVMFPHLARRREAAARFKREARAAAALDHPNILRVFDVGGGEERDGELEPPYIVLERIDGESLDTLVEKGEPPLAEVVAAIGVMLCRALLHAHAAGIIHRDVKPANVMMTAEGRLVLADFGIARLEDSEEDSVVTRTGAVLGTPAYMSPEQASGEPVTAATDLYSLGATLYRLATGSVPYAGTAAQVVASILEGKRTPAEQRIPAIGRELSRVLDTLMASEPEDRYPSAREAEEALQAIVAGGGFESSEKLLLDYAADPAGHRAAHLSSVVRASLVRARAASGEGRAPLALSIADRVMALEPGNVQAEVLIASLGRNKVDRRILLAIFGPMAVTAFVGAVFWTARPGPIAAFADAAPSDAWVVPETADAGVSSAADAASPPEDAAPANGAAVPTRRPERVRPVRSRPVDAGQAPPADAFDEPVPKRAPEPPPAAPETASLIVDIRPWCDVWIDGEKRSRASKKTSYELSPGTHTVECKQPSTQMRYEAEVTLRAGERRTLTGSVLAPVSVSVRLETGDEVRIGKRRIANGGSQTVAPGRMQAQVYRDGRPVGDARFIDFATSCTLRDKPKLVCSSR